jgi:MHS family citrate/tricarballylate:H+ symporter-like MFS transporter
MTVEHAPVEIRPILPARPCTPLRAALAVGLGNALEFYDFGTFSYFAIQIGHAFFPGSQPASALLYSLATFGAGFITRPLGGIMIGAYGDRAGRRPAMLLSFTLMGASITGMALTPSYSAVGGAAPVFLLIFRLLQGFALGGEVGPSTAYLMESAPANRRGLFVAMQSGTQAIASLTAALVGLALSTRLSAAALDAWGWRIAFLLGAAVVPAGLYIRRRLPEAWQVAAPRDRQDGRWRIPIKLMVLGLLVLGAMTITTYVRAYMTTYAQSTLKLSASIAFGATIVGSVCAVVGCFLGGLLSDQWGRRPVMLAALLALLVALAPGYILINRSPTLVALYWVTGLFSFLGAAAAVPALLAITESVPRELRSGTVGLLYAVAIAVFGGTTQFVIQWLIDATGSPLSPGWYNAAALIAGGIAMLLLPESAPIRVSRLPHAGSP